MRVLVFQHHDNEGPGTLGRLLRTDGGVIDTVHFTHGDAIPDFAPYDQLWILGGPMDVWDLEEHPWLADEKRAIRAWVRDVRKPCFGLCLGHQLLADSLNGTCGPMHPPEVGVIAMSLTGEAAGDPLMQGLPQTFPCVQWHSVRVAELPGGAVNLASSDACRIQIARFQPRVYGVQGHVEMEEDTVAKWGAIPEYVRALERVKDAGAIDAFIAETAAKLDEMTALSRTLYRNLMRLSG